MFTIQLPARINVLGNPSDANEGAHQTISAAINVFGEVAVSEGHELRMVILEAAAGVRRAIAEKSWPDFSQLEYGTPFDLQLAALRKLLEYSPELREKAARKFPELRFFTEIPRQSGLGGSTVLVLLTMLSLVRFYDLDPARHNEYALGELAQRAEEKELGITCGFADRYVPMFGGLAYLDYRGKLFHRPIKEEPYCVYERLDRWVKAFPLVMCSTGVQHDSGDVHRPMRARYLEEYKDFRGDYETAPFMVKIMKKIGDTAWKGKIALLEGDFPAFGELMNENHRLVDEMMRYCGYTAGAGEANNRMIAAGREAGALGAKLTGAGGGGSVFMLTPPGQEEKVAAALREALQKFNYTHGQVFIPKVVKEGTIVTGKDIDNTI